MNKVAFKPIVYVSIMALFACSCKNNPSQPPLIGESIFAMPLNDTTKALLIGDWKWEGTHTDGGKTLIYETYFLEIHEDSTFTKAYLTREFQLENKDIMPYGYCVYGKWHLKNGNLILEIPKTENTESCIQENKVTFYNEDELNIIDCNDDVEKWVRITNTKH
jgi:hypothetical protein